MKITMKVMGGDLNVRKEPSLEAEIINVLRNGEVIKTAPRKDGWAPCGSGYVMAKYLAEVAELPEQEPAPEADLAAAAKDLKDAAKDIKSAAKKTSAKKKAAAKK